MRDFNGNIEVGRGYTVADYPGGLHSHTIRGDDRLRDLHYAGDKSRCPYCPEDDPSEPCDIPTEDNA